MVIRRVAVRTWRRTAHSTYSHSARRDGRGEKSVSDVVHHHHRPRRRDQREDVTRHEQHVWGLTSISADSPSCVHKRGNRMSLVLVRGPYGQEPAGKCLAQIQAVGVQLVLGQQVPQHVERVVLGPRAPWPRDLARVDPDQHGPTG